MRLSTSIGASLLAAALSIGLAAAPAEAYIPDPIGPVGWVPDGAVLDVTSSGSRVFVGGEFTGGLAALDATTGALLWTADLDGPVRAMDVSEDGTRLIAGGGFTTAGGARHRRLAAFDVATGLVDAGWRASAASLVRDLVIQGDTAYFGGQFSQHDGIAQRGLGAVSVTTGAAVPSFDVATDGPVYGLSLDGGRLYVAGRFATIDGQARSNLASITLGTGLLDSWRPARACGGCNVQWDVLASGSTVYTVGRNDGAVVAYDAATAVRRWRVTANGDAQALALVDGMLYVGGHFVEIGLPRQPRTILAALNPATGAIDPAFAPRFVTTWPGVWALHGTSQRLYVGGYFTAAGDSPPRRFPYFAMFG